MPGTNPIAPYVKSNFTTMDPTTYKGAIDGDSVAAYRFIDFFLPHAQAVPNMTVAVDAGHIFTAVTLVEVAAQNTAAFTAPLANPRIDRIVADRISGAISVVAGTEAASPSAPAIPQGAVPIAQVLLTVGMVAITNNAITDERDLAMLGQVADNEVSVASAGTVDLGAKKSRAILITGSTGPITSFGNSASLDAPYYFVRFSGTPTLTNSASLILPGAANLTMAAGDWIIAKFEGSSTWRVVSWQPAGGISKYLDAMLGATRGALISRQAAGWALLAPGATAGQVLTSNGTGNDPSYQTPSGAANAQVFTSSGTWTKPAGANFVTVEMWGGGGGGGGGNASNQGGGGGGGGGYMRRTFRASDLGATESVTVGAGGTPTATGGNSSFGSHMTAYGGGGGASNIGAGGNGGNGIGAATGTAGGAGGNNNGTAGTGSSGGGGGGGGDGAGGSGAAGNGAKAEYGGGGGGGGGNNGNGTGGSSNCGGAGGNGGNPNGTAGTAPGGGGGGGLNGGASGARGEVHVYTW